MVSGTAATTHLITCLIGNGVADIPPILTSIQQLDPSRSLLRFQPSGDDNVNGVWFFVASDGIHGDELWRTDGLQSGTFPVKDIRLGSVGSYPHNLINVNGTLYFRANDGTSGPELWKSDGTAEGTVQVKEIRPGYSGSNPTALVNMNGVLYFVASDGVVGAELWRRMALNRAPLSEGYRQEPTVISAISGECWRHLVLLRQTQLSKLGKVMVRHPAQNWSHRTGPNASSGVH